MKLIITHANLKYDFDWNAKLGIDKLIKIFADEDIIELFDDNEGYLKHRGRKIKSIGGAVPDYLLDSLKDEREFVITGGYFNLCHAMTFKSLYNNEIGDIFFFPLPAIFTDLYYEKNRVIKSIIDNYSEDISIFWNSVIERESKKGVINVIANSDNLIEEIIRFPLKYEMEYRKK